MFSHPVNNPVSRIGTYAMAVLSAGALFVISACSSSPVVTSVPAPPTPNQISTASPVSEPLSESAGATDRSAASTCSPQCTKYVADQTQINFSKCWDKMYGNAGEWVRHAAGCKFSTSSFPVAGSIFEVMLIGPGGHVGRILAVKPYDKKTGFYPIQFADANFDNKCSIRSNAAGNYNAATNKLQLNLGSKTWYNVTGFITKWR